MSWPSHFPSYVTPVCDTLMPMKKRSGFTHFHHARISGKIVTLRLWMFKNGGQSPPLYWAAYWGWLCWEKERVREREGMKRKGRGTAVWTITSPHCSMEPCPVNSFHHGRVRRSPREKGGKGGGEEEEGEQWKILPVWLDGCWPYHREGSSLGHCGRSDERWTFLLMQIKTVLLSRQHAAICLHWTLFFVCLFHFR